MNEITKGNYGGRKGKGKNIVEGGGWYERASLLIKVRRLVASRQRGRIIFKRNGNERKARSGKRGAVEDRGSGRRWMGWMGNCKMSSFASFPELNTGCSRIPEFLAPSFEGEIAGIGWKKLEIFIGW